jgi:hypothetical protein
MTKEIRDTSIALAKSAKTLGVEIHKHNVVMMKHVAEHRDVSVMTHFLGLLMMKNPDGVSHSVVRAEAVKNWFETFGFAKYGKDKDGRTGFKLNKSMLDTMTADDLKAHFKMAAATPWNKLTPEKPFQIFDFDKALASLIKKANEKRLEVGDNGEVHKVDDTHLAAVKELAASIGITI